MDELFYWLLNMSIIASLTGAIVMLIRMIKKIPRRIIVVLWAIPLLRFWLPIGIGSKYGLMTLLSQFTTRTVVIYNNGLTNFSFSNSIMAANDYFPLAYKTPLLADVFIYGAIVWAIIATAICTTLTIIYINTLFELKDAKHLYDRVYCSKKVNTPAVYGIIRPRIIIPDFMKDSEKLELVVLHETRHIRRGDNFWRILALVTAAIHWFNPFVWIFLKPFLSDIELACDESALSKLPKNQQKEYALALLDVQESKTLFAASFGGAKIRTRIEHVISYKKMTVASAIGFGLLIAVISYMLLTNAA